MTIDNGATIYSGTTIGYGMAIDNGVTMDRADVKRAKITSNARRPSP